MEAPSLPNRCRRADKPCGQPAAVHGLSAVVELFGGGDKPSGLRDAQGEDLQRPAQQGDQHKGLPKFVADVAAGLFQGSHHRYVD